MRRMYSVQELTTIINQVVGEYIEAGALDESIADAVDAYLVEHPVDITALEGLDISVGSLDADGLVTGAEIVEKMSGYSVVASSADLAWTPIYVGIVKNGNKITLVIFGSFDKDEDTRNTANPLTITIPSSIGAKLYPYSVSTYDTLDNKKIPVMSSSDLSSISEVVGSIIKSSNTALYFRMEGITSLTNGSYFFRYEATFLLSDSLVA